MKHNFDTIFDDYKDIVFSKVLLTVGSFEDAEEITQNVFVKIYFGLENFRGQSNIKTWIYSIVRNTCIDYIRKKREGTVGFDDVEGVIEDDTSDFIERIESAEVIEYILSLLSLDERNIILMKCDDEMSFREISEIIHISESMAKKVFYNARQKFIDQYHKHYEENDS